MSNELIVVKQLPIIEEQLRQIKESIETRVQYALSLDCTEDTYKEIKKERAALSKDYKSLEDRRKEVKKAILMPYEKFELLYKECAGDIYSAADQQLKKRIDNVESMLKKEKADDVSSYFAEYAKSKGIDFLSFADSGIQVSLSVSGKNLKAQSKSFLDRVAADLAMIYTQEFKDEILVAYKKTLSATAAITTVVARHEAVEAERKHREDVIAQEAIRADRARETQQVVQEENVLIVPPTVEAIPEEKVYVASFTVRDTIERLRALKQFLTNGGYTYESN